MAKDLETKSVYQQLKEAGIEEEIAFESSRVAAVIFNLRTAKKSDIFLKIAQRSHYRDPLKLVELHTSIDDNLRLLEGYNFAKFNLQTGKYELTEKGEKVYRA